MEESYLPICNERNCCQIFVDKLLAVDTSMNSFDWYRIVKCGEYLPFSRTLVIAVVIVNLESSIN